MTKALGLILASLLTFGCSIPIAFEDMKQPLADIAEYDQYFNGLQRTARMLGLVGLVDEETIEDFIVYSNGAHVHYIKAHTALAAGKIKRFEKYLDAAYEILYFVEIEIEELMDDMPEQHHHEKGKTGI